MLEDRREENTLQPICEVWNAEYVNFMWVGGYKWIFFQEFNYWTLDVKLIFCFCFLVKNICDILYLRHERLHKLQQGGNSPNSYTVFPRFDYYPHSTTIHHIGFTSRLPETKENLTGNSEVVLCAVSSYSNTARAAAEQQSQQNYCQKAQPLKRNKPCSFVSNSLTITDIFYFRVEMWSCF